MNGNGIAWRRCLLEEELDTRRGSSETERGNLENGGFGLEEMGPKETHEFRVKP